MAIAGRLVTSLNSAPTPLSLPPASSISSWAARAAANGASSGSTPRSKRLEASEGSLCRLAERAIEIGSKTAASSITLVVLSVTSVEAPPITPAMPMGPDSSEINRSSWSSNLTLPSRVSSFSPAVARRTVMPPVSLATS